MCGCVMLRQTSSCSWLLPKEGYASPILTVTTSSYTMTVGYVTKKFKLLWGVTMGTKHAAPSRDLKTLKIFFSLQIQIQKGGSLTLSNHLDVTISLHL